MRRRVLILLAALVLAMLSATALVSYLKSADRRAVAGKQGVWVLVATGHVPAGTPGAEVRARTGRIIVPAETVPAGALTEWDPALDELRLTAPLESSQLLLRPLFQMPAPAASPSRRLAVPSDRLAVTVALSIAPQVAGDVAAGDTVTVYASCPLEPDEGDPPPRTRVLLPRAEVIVIGEAPEPVAVASSPSASASHQAVLEAPGAGPVAVGERYVATLAAGPKDAQRLVHAARYCALHLALLGASATVTPGGGVDTDGLFG
ncbi:RcpC/CpaB family pilus assembly protein [Actinoplanes sp. CA-252034]|uniref:RcpC/CpaB family pilus assembly protein n=1 Tax=Actinoplanes sp. CA-252034 TaxID=3239906 RepID=UPI003D98C320